jgi:hypothetical protein
LEKREYRITIHSNSRFVAALTVILFSTLILPKEYLPQIENSFISIIQILAIIISSFYLAHLIGKAKAKVLFTDEGYIHIWERRFFLSREKNFKIPWDIIDTYVFPEERAYDSFIINLTIKKRYKINRFHFLPLKDDFEKLKKDFPKYSNEYRQGIALNKDQIIKEGESIYENKAFKWIYLCMLWGFAILFIATITNPKLAFAWDSIGILGSGILFYGAMILKKRKKT